MEVCTPQGIYFPGSLPDPIQQPSTVKIWFTWCMTQNRVLNFLATPHLVPEHVTYCLTLQQIDL